MTAERPLWDDLAAGAERDDELPWGGRVVRNVRRPTLTSFLPDPGAATGTAVIVCPGGGFHFLSMESEGFAVARWLRDRGHSAHVLKYRTAPSAEDAEEFGQELLRIFSEPDFVRRVARELRGELVADGRRALELVRPTATRVVLLGFSAGGGLVAEVLRDGAEPDAAAIVYLPTVEDGIQPGPPLFLLAASDDPLGVDASLHLHERWRSAGRPVELHLYERGGHGFGMNPQGLPVDGWIERFEEWLSALPPAN